MDVSRMAVTAMAVLCSLVICNVRSADDGDAENNPPITQPDDDPTIPKNEAGEFPENGCSVHQWRSRLDTDYSKPCADDGGLQVPNNGKVRKLEITVPVGSTFEFSTLIAKSKIGYAAIYSECTKCGWWKREYRRHTRGSFPITKSFPETGEHTASVISKCRLQTVGSLGGQPITYGCGKDFTLDYTVHAIGVEEMKYSPEDGKSVYRDNLDLYIRGKMPDSSKPGTEITFTPSPSGGSNWPRETPDGLGEYKLPAWSMTNEVDYDESRPDSPYRLSGAFMHARKYSGDASLTYKANAVRTHVITAACGSAPPDEHGMSVPTTLEGDIAHKSYQLHVCAPQISVKFIHPKSDGCKVFYMARSYYMRKLIPFELTVRANGIPESFEPQIFRQDGNFSFYRTKGRYYEFVPEPVSPSSPNTSGIWHETFAIWVVEPPLTESESHISIRGTYGIDGTDIMDEDDDSITVKWYDPFNDDDPNNPRKLPKDDPNYEPPIDYHTPVDNPDWIPIPDDPELPPLPPVDPGTGGGDPAPPRPTPPGPPHTHDFVKTIACSYNYQNPDQVHLFTGNTVQELETLLTHAPQGTDDSCYFVKTCKGCGYSYQGPVHTHSASQMTYYICPRCDEHAEYFFTANKRRFHIRAACPCCASKDDSELIWVNVRDDKVRLLIDGDNDAPWNNWTPTAQDEIQKYVSPGKIVVTNEGCESEASKPDYANMDARPAESNLVPLELNIDSRISLDAATIRFEYEGWQNLPDFTPRESILHNGKEYYDYTVFKTGAIRLWANHSDPRTARNPKRTDAGVPGNYLAPGSYAASKIMNGAAVSGNRRSVRFWIEGVKPVGASTIKVTVKDNSTNPAAVYSDYVKITVIEGNITLNVDNDANFKFTSNDDIFEDQNGGFNCWTLEIARNLYGCKPENSSYDLENIFPFQVTIPPSLSQEKQYAIILDNCSGKIIKNIANTDPLEHLNCDEITSEQYIKALENADSVIVLPRSNVPERKLFYIGINSIKDPLKAMNISLISAKISAQSGNLYQIETLDTANLNFSGYKYALVDCTNKGNNPLVYYLDDNSTEIVNEYGPAIISHEEKFTELQNSQLMIYIHGYRVSLEEAAKRNRILYRRMYWTGFRGNWIGIIWHGNEYSPRFAPNERNAMQTAPVLLQFYENKVLNEYKIKPENITIMAHSLGNLLMWDMLRLYAHKHPQMIAAQNSISIEAAIWEECFADYKNIIYDSPLSDFVKYEINSLKQHSHAFWFNQPNHEATATIRKRINSYSDDDYALDWMQWEDLHLMFPLNARHYNRDLINLSQPARNIYKMAFDIPALMLKDKRSRTIWPDGTTSIEQSQISKPLGMTSGNGQVVNQFMGIRTFVPIDAKEYGWKNKNHNDCIDLPYYIIRQWYNHLYDILNMEL